MQSISLRWILPPRLITVKTAPQYNFQGSLRYVSPALWLQLGPLTPLCCTSPFFDHPRLPADQLVLVPRVFCLAPAIAGLFSDMVLVFTKKLPISIGSCSHLVWDLSCLPDISIHLPCPPTALQQYLLLLHLVYRLAPSEEAHSTRAWVLSALFADISLASWTVPATG